MIIMRKLSIACLCLLSPLYANQSMANPLADLSEAAEQGSFSGSLRYRFEQVDQDNALTNANASTLKARMTFTSATVNGWSSLLELDHVTTFGPDDYNSTTNGKGSYSVVADPEGSNVNQGYVKYQSGANTFTLGRQRILLGNQRYVGGVGWRQNEQTYNAFTYAYQGDSLTGSYSYLSGVNRIFQGDGTSAQAEFFDSDSHLLNLSKGNLNAYIYALDFKNSAALSSLTYGLDYKKVYDDLSLTAALAQQSDYGDNPTSYTALYYSFGADYKFEGATLTAKYEVMGSDDGIANFATPLATLHAFDGWADIFLGTASSAGFTDGLVDLSLGISGKLKGVDLALVYHDFSGDNSGDSIGSEIDAVATYKLSDKITTQLKYANYSADSFSLDTSKVWFMTTLSF